jgi:hypothetical protein
VVERLLSKMTVVGDCHIWIAATNGRGYGQINIGGGVRRQAHRLAYELFVGPIPPGYHIDHLCRTPLCINPAHLEAVSQSENNRREALARWEARGNRCIRGHLFAGHNATWTGRGNERRCRACAQLLALARKERAHG